MPATHPNRGDANQICRLLASEIRARLSAAAAAPWDDDTKSPITLSADDAGWPRFFAARLVRPEPGDIDFDRLRKYLDEFVFPTDPAGNECVRPLLERLRMWLRDSDDFSDDPDPSVHGALDHVEEVLTTYMRSADPAFEKTDCPVPTPRSFEVVGGLDRRYLKAVRWDDDGTPDDARRRRVRSRFERDRWRAVRFGTDPWYRVVAHDPKEKVFAVEWPYGPPEEGIPDGSTLVADGSTGDRPVYIELRDGRLDLLPAHPAPFLDGWNFGYDGGGPFSLVNAIERTFELVDGVQAEQLPRAWIRDQVNHADQGRLRIGVAALRRRMRTGEDW